MNTYEAIQQNIKSLSSVYDLAAVCYDYLLVQLDSQTEFITEYLGFSDDASKTNPNQKRLLRFSDDIKTLLFQEGYWNDRVLKKILLWVTDLEKTLKPFGKEIYNEATIAYFLLLGIDLYAECQSELNQNAPLNQSYQNASFIYRRQKKSILSAAAEKNEFRKKIKSVEIRNNISSLVILERTELKKGMAPPKMVTLFIDKADFTRNLITLDQTLVIATTPFAKEEICTFPRTTGDGFRVEYYDSYENTGLKRAIEILDLAIKHEANIVIFPEYACSPDVQEGIGAHLRETYCRDPHSVKELLLVITGSGWTQDDNNVAAVYSYSGKLLGKQYKNAPFDKEVTDPKTGKLAERWIEALRNPGKESVVVELPNIGSVMIAICRDISNWDYSEKMARIFQTNFMMAPAWSPSIHHAFINQLKSLTEANINTCSIVCNCCAAQSESALEKALLVTPYKKETIVEGKSSLIKRRISCEKKCETCVGCIFCLTLSFRPQDVEKGRILKSRRNYFR